MNFFPVSFVSSADAQNRVMHGIMRVGLLAKGLLLKGDLNLELVLLCFNKPTITLLNQVAESLLDHLEVQQQRHGRTVFKLHVKSSIDG